MNPSIRTLHKRLQIIFEMIEQCDLMVVFYKKQMDRFDSMMWKNLNAKEVNRHVSIRKRLQAWYADVFQRMVSAGLENNAKPLSHEQTITAVREMRNMEIAEETFKNN